MQHNESTDCTGSGGKKAAREVASTDLLVAREAAERLQCILEKESTTLRRFKNLDLMAIVQQKEALTRALAEKLKPLAKAKSDKTHDPRDPAYVALKASLVEIDRINRSNRVFILGALAHYQDLVKCLCPPCYGPRGVYQQRKSLAVLKGLTFRKEI